MLYKSHMPQRQDVSEWTFFYRKVCYGKWVFVVVLILVVLSRILLLL